MHPATLTSDKRVAYNLIYRANEVQIGFRFPMQGEIEITWKDLPLRSLVKLNHGFHYEIGFSCSTTRAASLLARSEEIWPATINSCLSVCPDAAGPNTCTARAVRI